MRTRHTTPLLAAALLSWMACQSSQPEGSGAAGEAGSGASSGATGPRSGEDHLARGARLYAEHCAVCHGDRGAADGPASPFLFPAARDFTQARYRLVRTANGVPSREDLVGTLRRGVPGSAMPAWGWMGDEDLDAMAAFVEHLSVRGLAYELSLAGRSDEEAMREARVAFTPGDVLPVAREVEASTERLVQGRELYLTHCASCHGPDGSGRSQPRFDEDGSLNWPRDFTAGYLKGERSARALGWRVLAGMPGTAMPGTPLAQDDLDALVAYLGELVPADAATHLVHRRESIAARRVEVLPEGPDDARWDGLGETAVVLAPLDGGRSADGITLAHVAAAHDGEQVALRVRWRDETGNLRIYSDLAGPDACALQFSSEETPHFFGMGAAVERTNIWHWKAVRSEEVAGALDLLEAPHVFAHTFRGEVRSDVPLYQPSASLPGVSEKVEALHAGGVGALATPAEGSAPAHAEPSWERGEWKVVFTRACAPGGAAGEVSLLPAGRVNVALAVWNGAAGDRGARKSISIWQRLELAP